MELAFAQKAKISHALPVALRQLLLLVATAFGIAYLTTACISLACRPVHTEPASSTFTTRETVEWNDARRWRRYVWVKPSPAIYAELDPAQTHLLDANRINNSRIIDAEVGANSPEGPPTFLQRAMAKVFGGPASRSLSADFEAALQNVLTLLSTL